jgi:hypothetical protein
MYFSFILFHFVYILIPLHDFVSGLTDALCSLKYAFLENFTQNSLYSAHTYG